MKISRHTCAPPSKITTMRFFCCRNCVGYGRAESARPARWQAETFGIVGVLRLLHVVVHRPGPRQERHVVDAIRRVDQLLLVVRDPREAPGSIAAQVDRAVGRRGAGLAGLAGAFAAAGAAVCAITCCGAPSSNAAIAANPRQLPPINAFALGCICDGSLILVFVFCSGTIEHALAVRHDHGVGHCPCSCCRVARDPSTVTPGHRSSANRASSRGASAHWGCPAPWPSCGSGRLRPSRQRRSRCADCATAPW